MSRCLEIRFTEKKTAIKVSYTEFQHIRRIVKMVCVTRRKV